MTRHDGKLETYFALVERLKPAASVSYRHDLCSVSMEHALQFARIESDRGLRATYFPLHTERYWNDRGFPDFCRRLVDLGHTVGLHHDALTAFVRTCREPRAILLTALDFLRKHVEVTMAAAHGAPECYGNDGRIRYMNYEVFSEFDPAKNVGGAGNWNFERVAAKELGLVEVYLHGEFTRYGSDSAGSWRGWRGPPLPKPFERIGGGITEGLGALDGVGPEDRVMLLTHPCYWSVP